MSRSSNVNLRIQARKADISRIIAIADYFLNLVDEDSYERKSLSHTAEFYSQLNDLVKQGYMKAQAPKKDDPSVVTYLTIVDYSFVEELAEAVGIRIFEYLYHGGAMKNS